MSLIRGPHHHPRRQPAHIRRISRLKISWRGHGLQSLISAYYSGCGYVSAEFRFKVGQILVCFALTSAEICTLVSQPSPPNGSTTPAAPPQTFRNYVDFHLGTAKCLLQPLVLSVALSSGRLLLHRMRWSRPQREPNYRGCRMKSRLLQSRRHPPLSKIKQTVPWPTALLFLSKSSFQP